jgi:hypothetical protein
MREEGGKEKERQEIGKRRGKGNSERKKKGGERKVST